MFLVAFYFILMFTRASNFLIFMCCCTLVTHYFVQMFGKSTKYVSVQAEL